MSYSETADGARPFSKDFGSTLIPHLAGVGTFCARPVSSVSQALADDGSTTITVAASWLLALRASP